MEEVPGSCWARVYGVIGIPGSWQLLVLSLSLSFSLYLSTAPPSLSFSPLFPHTVFSEPETVETDLQAGANHRYEVLHAYHFHRASFQEARGV
jgi:hypothetical protein